MKLRYVLTMLLAVFVASYGVLSAQDHTHHGTPESHDHSDHADHGDHDHHGMEGVSMGAFYFTVTNNGDEADTLVKIESDIADIIEIHNVEMDDGVMQMVPMHDGVEIAAGESVVLEPGGYHVMLIGITESLLDGEDFTATVHFENAGEVEITVPIYIFEPEDEEFSDPVDAGDIEISNIWARQAPRLEGTGTPMATPAATPDQN